MNWIKENKNKLFMLGLAVVFAATYIILVKFGQTGVCGNFITQLYPYDRCMYISIHFIIWPALIVCALINMFTKENVVKSWKRFTLIYLFIYLFIVILTPYYGGDAFFSVQKSIFALALSALYLFISIILIIYKSLKKSAK